MRRVIYSTKDHNITAAEDEFDIMMDDPDSFSDDIEDVADAVEDIQDVIEDDDTPVDTIIDTENNIKDHYIAECEHCHGIFISAVMESDSPIASISGECPLCHEETEQDLKWIIKSTSDSDV